MIYHTFIKERRVFIVLISAQYHPSRPGLVFRVYVSFIKSKLQTRPPRLSQIISCAIDSPSESLSIPSHYIKIHTSSQINLYHSHHSVRTPCQPALRFPSSSLPLPSWRPSRRLPSPPPAAGQPSQHRQLPPRQLPSRSSFCLSNSSRWILVHL